MQATEALKKEHEEIIEHHRVAQKEKEAIQAKFDEDRAKIQKDKE